MIEAVIIIFTGLFVFGVFANLLTGDIYDEPAEARGQSEEDYLAHERAKDHQENAYGAPTWGTHVTDDDD